MENIWIILFVALMIPGLVGVFLPIVPGIPYMFIVALAYAFLDRFLSLTVLEIGILFAIAAGSVVIDHMAGATGARLGGASSRASMAGLLGSIVGLILLPPFGSIIGLIIGVLMVELQANKKPQEVRKAVAGSVLGTVAGIAINFVVALIFIGLFIGFAW